MFRLAQLRLLAGIQNRLDLSLFCLERRERRTVGRNIIFVRIADGQAVDGAGHGIQMDRGKFPPQHPQFVAIGDGQAVAGGVKAEFRGWGVRRP